MSLLKTGDAGAEVRLLQEQLRELGFFDDISDGIFGPKTKVAVKAFQLAHGLDVDGIFGPQTRATLDEEISTALRHAGRERDGLAIDVESHDEPSPVSAEGSPRSSGTDAGRPERVMQVLAAGADEWIRPVHEPPGEGWERIDSYIRGEGGLGWSSEARYVRNRQFAWCGAFAAFCFGKAGLKKTIRKRVMPSTYRLYSWAKGNERMRQISEVGSGDIVLVGPSEGKRWGAHITICDEVDAVNGHIHTIEGNASGRGPNDDRYEGVVRQSRPLPSDNLPPKRYRVMHVIRPLSEDYE
jgi:hypothetical protein